MLTRVLHRLLLVALVLGPGTALGLDSVSPNSRLEKNQPFGEVHLAESLRNSELHSGNYDAELELTLGCYLATKGLAGVPGRVLSRINISNKGFGHVVNRHFNSAKNASQFTISQGRLKGLLQSKSVVNTPVTRTLNSADGIRYVREINAGSPIGLNKFNNFKPTSTFSVVTDKFGNLVTATPGVIR